MARNQEKAQYTHHHRSPSRSMLYRFREAMKIETGVKRDPHDATQFSAATCTHLPAAEQRRRELTKEISRKLSKIQDLTIDEYQIRILNDEINTLLREKVEWDARIVVLGGIESRSTLVYDEEGIEVPNVHGYRYFGRARELPGVKELLDPHREERTKIQRQRRMLYENVDAKYFGYGEENDAELLAAEHEAERKLASFEGPVLDWVTSLPAIMPVERESAEDAQVLVPSQEDVQQYLLQKRKQELLQKYTASDS